MMRLIAGLTIVLLTSTGEAQEWTRFRGPNGEGVSPTVFPTEWNDKTFAWKATVPGVGHSSPVVWGNKVFLTSGDKSGQRLVLCYSADEGKELWRKETTAPKYKTHQRNSVATATPVVDEKHLYVTWATPQQYSATAYDHDGKTVWEQNLGPYKSQHGFGVSPIRFDDLLIVANDQDDGGSLVALDAKDGKVRWTIPRNPKNATYATPCVFADGKRPPLLLFTNWQHGVTAVDPKTGKVVWEKSVFNTKTNERSIASPVVAGNLILATCGFVTGQKHHVALRVGEDAKPVEAWRVERQVAYLPTPIIKDGRVYLISELGIATCLKLQTGEEVWSGRLDGAFSASPVAAGEHLYCVSNDGIVHVLKLGDTYQHMAKNSLGEGTQSTPAISGGRLFIRTETKLLAIRAKQ